MNNGLIDIYTSTYDFKETGIENDREVLDRTTIIIPHIMFDLDSDSCYEDMLKLHNYALENSISHIVIFSGRGFHVYYQVKLNSENSIIDVLHYQNRLIKSLDILVDPTCIGNPASLIRVPGTFNLKRGKWCISLRRNEIESSLDHIKSIAEKQRTRIYIIKGKKLELPHIKSSHVVIDTPEYAKKNISDLNIDALMLPPCLQANVKPKGHIPNTERVYITQFLSDLYREGITIDQLTELQIQEIIEKIVRFFEPVLMDFKESKTRYYVNYIVRRYNLSPSCQTLKEKNICLQNIKCWREQEY